MFFKPRFFKFSFLFGKFQILLITPITSESLVIYGGKNQVSYLTEGCDKVFNLKKQIAKDFILKIVLKMVGYMNHIKYDVNMEKLIQ
ncbi:hypothetical protein FFONT_0998 [Fervidicoccus fontis Kam940]|uniref:Uncharacterized protein n=2 Tax=Fervidicoccus fontis TaxID=683846 RepID=I0A1X9_FERFK|nr:hypothetical protein FFONT_0998 [Fervidicoccus fontis Kam940]PMB75465.1 MAG: hypothetical protein C0188_03030 [Fervidicoccus fontis]PMB77330.1 MAG: hypothetical protein C0177_03470 [Fervidicoccus fontis]PMB78612.1 MAG: hypothetical protein C0177_00020 [Fervidicoccus fontis]